MGTGTSQGVPVIACGCDVCRSKDERDTRFRTSALVTVESGEGEGTNILIDIGPDFRQQMLRQGVDHLDAILITHGHRDHVAGLDDIRSFNYVQHKKMDIYLNDTARTILERDYRYVFAPHEFPGLPEAELHTVDGEAFVVGSGARAVDVVPIRAMHKDMPILGYRIGELGYVTDANHIDDEELRKLQGVDTLVINALRLTHHYSHFSLPEALEVIERVGPRRAYLTHISHEMGRHAEVSATLPEGVELAYDNLQIEI